MHNLLNRQKLPDELKFDISLFTQSHEEVLLGEEKIYIVKDTTTSSVLPFKSKSRNITI